MILLEVMILGSLKFSKPEANLCRGCAKNSYF